MNYLIKRGMALTCAVGMTAPFLAGCDASDVTTVLAGVDAACIGAGVLANVSVIVTSSIGGSTAVTGGKVGNDVTASCQSIETATQAIINKINAQGGTATVTVTTSPTTAAMRMVSRLKGMRGMHVWRDRVTGNVVAQFVVPPSSPGILGTFTDILTQLD